VTFGSGIALVRKPAGITSFQALQPIKQALGTGRVGHAGTLDRFAEGLLVVLAGPYARLVPWVQSGRKEYRGHVRFGTETATLDPEGVVVGEGSLPSRADLEAVLPSFRGSIRQRPPAYSALHIDGKRAYERALAGEEPEMPERLVQVFCLELDSYEDGLAALRVSCSAGTYIRSLARDLALACGSRAHLAALERRAIGPFGLESAVDPGEFQGGRDLSSLLPAQASGLGLRAFCLGEEQARLFSHGAPTLSPSILLALDGGGPVAEGEAAAVFGPGDSFLGVAERCGDRFRYRMVLGRAP